jgi:hypothetical protein
VSASAKSVIAANDMTRWDSFLGSVRSGMRLKDAMAKYSLARREIESFVRLPARLRWPGFPAIPR